MPTQAPLREVRELSNDTKSPSLPLGASPRSLALKRIHSLSGVLPVGGFLLLHLWTNAHALFGQRSFDRVANKTYQIRSWFWLEIACLYLPLVFHALYGVRLSLISRLTTERNWGGVLQRLTGLVAFVFIAGHFWQFRLQVFLGKMDEADFFPTLCATLSSTNGLGIPVIALGYVVGIAASTFHFANGFFRFCLGWGVATTERARRWMLLVALGLGCSAFLAAGMTVVYFATGSNLLVERAPSHP